MDITERELAGLPSPVAAWLRRVGVVGRPRVDRFRVRFGAAIRGAPREKYMRGTAWQDSTVSPPERLFRMKVRKAGLPVRVRHHYQAGHATMEARLLGLLPLVELDGPELSRSETVTVLNDLFLLAPGAIPFAGLAWEVGPEEVVRAILQVGGHRVSAALEFDHAGDLVGFRSDDRYRSDRSGHHLERWSTPILTFQELDGLRLPREAEARWGVGEGAWTYARFVVESVDYG